MYALERAASLCSGAELVQNPEDFDLLARLGVPSDKLVLLGNGVDLERFRPAQTTQRRRHGPGEPRRRRRRGRGRNGGAAGLAEGLP